MEKQRTPLPPEKHRKKSVVSKEKDNRAAKTFPLDDPNAATSKINMKQGITHWTTQHKIKFFNIKGSTWPTPQQWKRHVLGESKSINIIGATVVEKLSNPFDRQRNPVQIKTSRPGIKAERHNSILAANKTTKSTGNLKSAVKPQLISTDGGGSSSDRTKAAESRSVSVESHAKENVSGDEDTLVPDKLHSGTWFTPCLDKNRRCQIANIESSEYWISQIRMAESAGNHSAAAEFFQIALKCKAKPVECLLDELQAYSRRHSFLLTESAWKNVIQSYMPLTIENKYLSFENPFFEADNHPSNEAGESTPVANSSVTDTYFQYANLDEMFGRFSANHYTISKTRGKEESPVTGKEHCHEDSDHDAYPFQEDLNQNLIVNGPHVENRPWIGKSIHSQGSSTHFRFTNTKTAKDTPGSVKIRERPETSNQAGATSNLNEKIFGPIARQSGSERNGLTKSKRSHGIKRRILQSNSPKRLREDRGSKPSTLLSVLPWSVCALEYLLAVLWTFLLILLLYFIASVFVVR